MTTDTLSASGVGPERIDSRAMARRRLGRRSRLAVRYTLLILTAAIVLFPIYVTVVDALLTPHQIVSRPPALFPTDPQWGTFATAFREADMGVYLRNSAIMTVAIVLVELVTATLAAYAFVFVRFPLRGLAFVLCLATLMVPMEATIIPNYQTIEKLGLFDTFGALILPFVASGIGIFLLRQSFSGVPRELRDSARLDGCGHLSFLFRIVVPLNRPVLAAFGLYVFLSSWNQYLWPLVVTQTANVRPVQIGLRQLSQTNFSNLNVVFAGTLLAVLPIAVLLFAFQRQLVRGLTAGAVKG